MLVLLVIFIGYYFLFRGLGFWLQRPDPDEEELAEIAGVFLGAALMALALYPLHFFLSSSIYLLIPFGFLAAGGWLKYWRPWRQALCKLWLNAALAERALAIFAVITLLAYSALPSSLIDEGLYYAQAIRWFEEAGMVRGLPNFDYYLGQASSLHALESLVNGHWWDWRFNDLGVFFASVWAGNLLLNRRNFGYWPLIIAALGLLSFTALLSATNSDLTLFLIASVLLLKDRQNGFRSLNTPIALVALAVLVKLNGLVLLVWLFFQPGFKTKLSALATVALVAFKNWYVTGFLFFPFFSWQWGEVPWQIPKVAFAMQAKLKVLLAYEWFFAEENYRSHSFSENFVKLFFQNGATSLVLWISLLGLLAYGFRLAKTRRGSPLWAVALSLYFLAWWYFSPQGRLLLPFAWLPWLGLFRFSAINRTAYALLASIYALLSLLLFLDFASIMKKVDTFSRASNYRWQIQWLLQPAPVWNIETETVKTAPGKFQYQKPKDLNYCFYAQFPCTPYGLNDYLVNDSLYLPVPLGESYQDGFTYRAIPYDTVALQRHNSLDYRFFRRYFQEGQNE